MKYCFYILIPFLLFSCGKNFDSSLASDTSDFNAANSSINRANGDPARGGNLYSTHCMSCHNSDGSGDGIIPNIQGATDADILNAVEMGYGDMNPVLDLSIDDIEDISSIFDSFL